MTRKDFILIAATIKATPSVGIASHSERRLLAAHFADALATTNDNFDRERFIAAATGE